MSNLTNTIKSTNTATEQPTMLNLVMREQQTPSPHASTAVPDDYYADQDLIIIDQEEASTSELVEVSESSDIVSSLTFAASETATYRTPNASDLDFGSSVDSWFMEIYSQNNFVPC